MKNVILLCLVNLTLLSGGQNHPRMLFDSSDIPQLRAKLVKEPYLSIYKEVYANYQKIDLANKPLATSSDSAYDESIRAALAGFLFTLTDSMHYADKAMQLTKSRIYGKVNNLPWASTSLKGLTSYWMGTYIALAYDMCYSAWPDTFQTSVSTKLNQMADMIAINGGSEQNTNSASNWQGIRGSAAILCYLATDNTISQPNFSSAVKKLHQFLVDNMGDIYTSSGWNIEGLGYTYYPMGNFIGPAIIALPRFSPLLDFKKYPSVINNYYTIYASLSNAMDLLNFGSLHPDFGDDNPHVSGEGVFGQSFYFLPDSLKAGAKYWYDKVIAARPNIPHDNYRYGAVYSYLYYNDTIVSRDPSTLKSWGELATETGGNGYFTFRNAFLDSNDAIAQMYIKFRGNKGHAGPDALSYRIIANSVPWAVGGGRYGKSVPAVDLPAQNNDAYNCSMNTLYLGNPDNKITTNGNSGKLVGTPYIGTDGSGHVISTILKNNVGVNNHKRWFVANYDSAQTHAKATYLIGDVSDDGKAWQICTYQYNTITTDTNTFTIASPGGKTMKGTILYPTSNFRYTIGQRKRGSNFGDVDTNSYIWFMSDDGDYLVSLTIVDSGATHPTVTASGIGVVGNKVTIGSKVIELANEDVLYSDTAISKPPILNWNLSRISGQAPLQVRLDASSSYDPEGLPLVYSIDYGNGDVSTDSISETIYNSEGNYAITITVRDANGFTKTAKGQVNVWNSSAFNNISPTASVLSPAANARFFSNDTVPVSSVAWDVDGYVSKVEFYAENTASPYNIIKFDTDTLYPFNGNWNSPVVGTWNVYSVAYDNYGLATTSSKKKIFIDAVVGIIAPSIEKQEQGIRVYPNPIRSGQLQVYSPIGNIAYSVFDITGKHLLNGFLEEGINIIPTSSLNKGVYILSTSSKYKPVKVLVE